MTTCRTCKDYKFVEYFTEYTSDPRFGKAVPCPDCQGGESGARVRRLQKDCAVPELYRSASVGDFEYPLAESIADSEKRRIFFTVWGNAGVGKTHLLTATVNDAVLDGMVAVYAKWGQILDHLRNAYAQGVSEDADGFWRRLKEADVLAIDEVDKARLTDFAAEKLFDLVDYRYSRMNGLTLFATNRRFEQGDAIVGDTPGPLESRLRERGNVVLKMGGQDRRPQQQMRWLHE